MSTQSPTRQQPKIDGASDAAEALPVAVEGQLQWVKRPLSSLSASATSGKNSDGEEPSLWWPSLFFNDYDDFQGFFSDEFNTSDINENNETRGLVMARMFQNMRQQRTVMVARLLGRSIREYIEIVEPPEGEESKSDSQDSVEDYQATDFVSFILMPQEIHIPQMKPKAFVVESSGDKEAETIIIDDELYMSYMFALDLAASKRMGGPHAPNNSLKSDFREMGRFHLENLAPSVKRLSETSKALVSSDVNGETAKQQQPNESEEEDSDDSDSEEEIEEKEKSEDVPAQTALATEGLGANTSSSTEPATSKESTESEIATEASLLQKVDTESAAPAAKYPVENTDGSSVEQGKEGGTNAATNGTSSPTPSSATIISQSSEGSEATDTGTASMKASPGAATTKPPAPKRKPGRKKKNTTTKTPPASAGGPKRSKRGRRPKETVDLPATTSKEKDAQRASPTSPKRSKRGRRPKEIVDLQNDGDGSSKSLDTSDTTPPINFPSPKKRSRGRSKKTAASPETTSKNKDASGTTPRANSPPRKKSRRGRAKKKADAPQTPSKEDTGDAAGVLFTPPPRIDRCVDESSKAEDTTQNTKGKDSMDDTQGGDATIAKTSSPARPTNSRTVTIVTTTPSPQNRIDIEGSGINLDDSFEDVCHKLEFEGWTCDLYENLYFGPGCGFDDIKMNPKWKGDKFFLTRRTFLNYLRKTYGWTVKKTPKKGAGKRSNAVTPTSSLRPKRTCRTPSFPRDDGNNSPTVKTDQYKFKSEDEEKFYFFPTLMNNLKNICGWKYQPAKTNTWHYVLPGGKRESKGGKHHEDFFFEESEVVLYCMNNNYYERREELGLGD